jgi:hypothetical protein
MFNLDHSNDFDEGGNSAKIHEPDFFAVPQLPQCPITPPDLRLA